MSNNKRVLLIGFEPTTLDFGSFPDFNAEKVMEGLKKGQEKGLELGYEIEICLINPDGSDIDIISQKLSKGKFNCVLIGAGVRVSPEYFLLFEKAINLVHQNAPSSIICFNTNPNDSLEAIQRWI
ncbi:hypothetical protein [Nitrosopumilus sp.]|uniref:hypothetical protein n=1 Tax=Nitrosopumilus sp. TaxID=2024843 RepID=UPI003D09C452